MATETTARRPFRRLRLAREWWWWVGRPLCGPVGDVEVATWMWRDSLRARCGPKLAWEMARTLEDC